MCGLEHSWFFFISLKSLTDESTQLFGNKQFLNPRVFYNNQVLMASIGTLSLLLFPVVSLLGRLSYRTHFWAQWLWRNYTAACISTLFVNISPQLPFPKSHSLALLDLLRIPKIPWNLGVTNEQIYFRGWGGGRECVFTFPDLRKVVLVDCPKICLKLMESCWKALSTLDPSLNIL